MEKVGAKAEAGDQDQRLKREIRLENDKRDQPGKNADDAQRQDVFVAGKDPGLDGEEINGENHRVAHHQEHIGKLRQNPFPKRPLENEEEKIEPDQAPDMDERPWVSL